MSRHVWRAEDVPSLGRPFLTARWELLAMLNWRVDPALLAPYTPPGTVLDTFDGAALVSMVGFLFLDTRIMGVAVPLHRDFEELNLRCYVRRELARPGAPEVRRGVTFVKEVVPRAAIATVARWAYNEPYEARPMQHEVATAADGVTPVRVEYRWRQRTRPDGWGRLAIEVEGPASQPAAGSEAAFVSEHYWGYTAQRGGGTTEYQVHHEPWRVWAARRVVLEADLEELYGRGFAEALDGPPSSAFLADGSAISVLPARQLAPADGG